MRLTTWLQSVLPVFVARCLALRASLAPGLERLRQSPPSG
jgi:hypothetical protein